MTDEQTCVHCSAHSPAAAKFCVECGQRFGRSCPSCGAVADGFRFCMECGSPLDAAASTTPVAASRPAAAPVSERRTTTVLFGDLVGFTTLSESRDPEDVRELLSTYFEVARTVVGRYGGTIEKFIGDAVMAVWGVPVAHEDDAERAVRAGLDLAAEVAALGESLGASGLSMRVGLVTGSVAVTLGAVNEGMVAGDAVNTAARVQAAASPGSVWVDQETRGLTAAAITFSDMGEHELKGKAEPLRLFRADAIVAAVGGAQRVDGLEAPMVGREREIREVKELFHATQTDGRTRLALVSGVAGVGKTRLGWEFEKYVDGLSDGVRWHRGRCLSYGEGIAYRAFAEMMRSRLGLLEGEAVESMEGKVRDYVGAVSSSPDEAAWMRPRLLALLSTGSARFERSDLFAAWSTFLERVARDEPLVLVFEDMQHADSGLLDLLEYLLQSCRASLFVLVLARPELLEDHPSLARGRRAVVIELAPLPEPSMETLVDALVGDLPASARGAVVNRSEGIPLYAVETVRSLIDRDAVVSRGGRYVFVDQDGRLVDLEQLSAPSSLRTLVSARLDALTPQERRTVQDASVLGLSFTHAGVLAVSGLSDFEVDGALDGLVRKGIVVTQDDPRSPEIGQYQFLQGIVREVAHDTLSRRDRRERHLAAARHIEATAGEEAVGPVVAQHLIDALEAGGPRDADRAELLERARGLLAAAADRAAVLGSPDEALRTLQLVLTLEPDPEERATATSAAAAAAQQAGRHALAEELAIETERLCADLGRTRERLLTMLVRARSTALMGRTHEALELAEAVETELESGDLADDDALWLELLVRMSYVGRATYEPERYRAVILRQLALAERLGDRRAIAQALNGLAIALVDMGSPSAYLALLVRATGIARENGDLESVTRSLINLTAETYPDDLVEAVRLGEEAWDTGRRVGQAEQQEVCLTNLSFARWLAGDWDQLLVDVTTWFEDRALTTMSGHLRVAESLVLAARGLPLPEVALLEAEDDMDRLGNALTMAHRQVAAGDLAGAATSAVEAFRRTFLGTTQVDDFEVMWAPTVDLLIGAGDLDGARDLVDLGAELLSGWHRRLAKAETARLRGTVARARGEDPEAELRTAIRAHEEYGAPYLLALARDELGSWLVEQGREDEGRPLLGQAAATFERLGAVVAAAPLRAR